MWEQKKKRDLRAQKDDHSESYSSYFESITSSKGITDTNLDWMWEYVENGMQAVGDIFGLAELSQPSQESTRNKKEELSQEPDAASTSLFDNLTMDSNTETKSTLSSGIKTIENEESITSTSSSKKILRTAEADEGSDNETGPGAIPVVKVNRDDTAQGISNSSTEMEELGQSAAQTFHRKQGLVFDFSKINVSSDLKVFVINISLPLGRKFSSVA